MTMEAFDAGRKLVGQLLCQHAEAAAGSTRVIEFGFYLAVFGVDTQAAGYGVTLVGLHLGIETLVLAEGVEGEMSAATEYLGELFFGIGGTVGMRQATELFVGQAGLGEAAGGGMGDVLAEDGEGLPQCKGLEGQNNLCPTLSCHLGDEGEVATQ